MKFFFCFEDFLLFDKRNVDGGGGASSSTGKVGNFFFSLNKRTKRRERKIEGITCEEAKSALDSSFFLLFRL